MMTATKKRYFVSMENLKFGIEIGLLAILPLLTVFPTSSYAFQSRVDVISVPGNLINASFADLDGDSISEALLFYVDTGSERLQRKLALYRNSGDRFDSHPTQVLEIEASSVCYDIADIDADGRKDLLLCGTEGMIFHTFDGRLFDINTNKRLKTATIFNIAPEAEIARWNSVVYSQGQTGALILIPTPRGFDLYRIGKDGPKFGQSLEYRHRLKISGRPARRNDIPAEFILDSRLPSVVMGSYDGDRMADIFIAGDRFVHIYRGNFDGGYSSQPVEIFGKRLLTAEEEFSGDVALSFKIQDLNSDGLSDIIATKNSGTVTSFNTTISIFKAKQLGGYGPKCNWEFTMANGASSPTILDFNADGALDLALPSFKLGVMSTLKILLMKEIEVNLKIYLQGGQGDFPEKQDYEKGFSYEVLLDEGIDYNNIMILEGDYDGDGACDLLLHDGQGKLRAYGNKQDGSFADNSLININLPRPDGLAAEDLNGDGKHEIIAFYGENSNERKSLRIVWIE